MSELTKQSRQEILKQGQSGEFWLTVIGGLNESKKSLENQRDDDRLKDLPADQYKLENELLKAKIQYLEKLKNLPNSMIDWLQLPDTEKVEYDPYE